MKFPRCDKRAGMPPLPGAARQQSAMRIVFAQRTWNFSQGSRSRGSTRHAATPAGTGRHRASGSADLAMPEDCFGGTQADAQHLWRLVRFGVRRLAGLTSVFVLPIHLVLLSFHSCCKFIEPQAFLVRTAGMTSGSSVRRLQNIQQWRRLAF